MPAKNVLIENYHCNGVETLETISSVMQTRGFFTSTQAKTFQVAIRTLMPCKLKIEQRMPKSVIYVTADSTRFTISNRAKLQKKFTSIGINT
jgi:hypothetical protein